LYRLQQNGDFAFTVLKRTPSYEIRQYEPFLQVETGVAASDIATALENGKRDLEILKVYTGTKYARESCEDHTAVFCVQTSRRVGKKLSALAFVL
jgi:uncharacterized protein CbrC (UPF0167 family)